MHRVKHDRWSECWGHAVREMLRFYREFTMDLPDEANVQAGIQPLPGKSGLWTWIAVCYCGDLDTGEKALKPLRSFGPRAVDAVQPIPYAAMQALLDAPPAHLSTSVRSSFLRELNDEAIDVIAANAAQSTPWITISESMSGKPSRFLS